MMKPQPHSSLAMVRPGDRAYPSNRGPGALEVTVIVSDGSRVRLLLPIGASAEVVAGSAALAITTNPIGEARGSDLVGIRPAA